MDSLPLALALGGQTLDAELAKFVNSFRKEEIGNISNVKKQKFMLKLNLSKSHFYSLIKLDHANLYNGALN